MRNSTLVSLFHRKKDFVKEHLNKSEAYNSLKKEIDRLSHVLSELNCVGDVHDGVAIGLRVSSTDILISCVSSDIKRCGSAHKMPLGDFDTSHPYQIKLSNDAFSTPVIFVFSSKNCDGENIRNEAISICKKWCATGVLPECSKPPK